MASCSASGPSWRQLVGNSIDVDAQRVGVGFEAGDDAGVHELTSITFHRTSAFDQNSGDAPGTLAQLLDANHLVGQIEITPRRELRLRGHHTDVESGKLGAQFLLGCVQRDLLAGECGKPSALRADLSAAQEDLQRAELGDQVAVATSRIGLSLERSELPTHLAKQILHTQQAGLGGVETTLGALFAASELQHAGGFLDDRPPLLRPGVQHRVDLALAHDHVLLATDARVAEHFLNVEQATGDTVDRVLALASAEQDASHGDLRELDWQQPRGVVDGERHLGPTERRPLGRAREDHVVHLLTAHRTGGLGAQHPGDGVDHVRLAGAVGSDHHRDPRLKLEGGRVGERFESFEGQRLQEHGALDHSRADPTP